MATAKPPEGLKVRRGVDPSYLQSVLTKDITPLESIYDLVDNSIDAARDLMFRRGKCATDKYGLPADYSGFRVSLRFGSDSVCILDNCSGIEEDVLAQRVFVTGSLSSHRFGIGRFGIGLKRALFRLGSSYSLSTDTGSFAARMKFGESELGSANEGALIAGRHPTKGRRKTLICVSALRDGVQHEFGSESWKTTIIKSLSRRYGIYIAKGFSISVDGQPVPNFGSGIRRGGPVADKADSFITTEGVRIFIDSGMHERYRLTQEADYEKALIDALTDQYGWYFVCNDRIIKVASHESDLGWTSNWHQEYYGFVGWVRFVAEDVENLPWDTKKSSIDHNSPVFRQLTGKLQQFAEDYKTENKRARKGKEGTSGTSSGKSSSSKSASSGSTAQTKSKGSSAEDHNENWTTLLPTMDVSLAHPKVKALVYEATHLPIENAYSASMLFRAIMEAAAFECIKTAGHYKSVRQMVFDKQEADGRAFTEEQKKAFRPTFRDALDWLSKSDDFFPDEQRRDCLSALKKFGKHLRELNGVVHEGDLTDSGKLKIVRNDTMPLLRFLLDP